MALEEVFNLVVGGNYKLDMFKGNCTAFDLSAAWIFVHPYLEIVAESIGV